MLYSTTVGEMRLRLPSITILVNILVLLIASAASPPLGHPRNYVATRVSEPIKIDGDIYKKVWDEVPWSQDFVEIRGVDAPSDGVKPTADTRTRMKMRWDDDYLYIAAEMTAHNWVINAEFTDRNEPIFQKDSDFEVFIDADGSNSFYKELELNARNTVWNLMLNKPYSSGGEEHSGRIAKAGDAKYWDVKGQETKARMYGAAGKPNPNGKWTSEIALKHTDTIDRTGGSMPAVGKFWRINFSRVEKKGAINWVWSPQMVWTPLDGKYVGQVNMHAPDAWGYIVFGEAGSPSGTQQDWTDPDWNVKAAAHQLFYAEKLASGHEGGGKLLSPDELMKKHWIDRNLFQDHGIVAEVTQSGSGWTASIQDKNGCTSTIQQDNLHSFSCRLTLLGLALPGTRYASVGFGAVSIAVMVGVFWAFRHKVLKPQSAAD
jgi:hypothetical protein